MILVAGCGSLGCELARRLREAPVCLFRKLTFVDFDRFEPHNERNQKLARAGMLKAEVLADYLRGVYETEWVDGPVEDIANPSIYDVVFSLCDSVPAREFCIRNCRTVVDVGVSAEQFSVRCYSARNSAFIDLFTQTVPRECMVTRIESPEDLVRYEAAGLDDFDDIVRACRRSNATIGFAHDFTHEFVRSVLRIRTQSACLCQIAVRKAIERAKYLISGNQVADVLIGTFAPFYNEQEYGLDVSEDSSQRVTVFQGKIVSWPEMGIAGAQAEIQLGKTYFV